MPISMPTRPGFTACRFGLMTHTQTFTSPLSNATQRALLGGAKWMANYSLPAMNRAQMADWQAFILQLEGGVNTFNAYDPDAMTPRGVATGTPLVKGASQTGSTLLVDGLPASLINWLLPGDYFACNGELKMLTQPANTNGSGETTLYFKPALRNSPADNAPLTVNTATCTMVLTDDAQSMWQTGTRIGFYEPFSFSAYEVF